MYTAISIIHCIIIGITLCNQARCGSRLVCRFFWSANSGTAIRARDSPRLQSLRANQWIMNSVPVERRPLRRMRVWIVLSLCSLFSILSLSLSFTCFTSPFSSPSSQECVYENALATRARHTSWLLIHVAVDYFSASLWHQIPYSSQNGESVSLRARWSTRASDSHRILTLFTRPLSGKYFWQRIPFQMIQISFHLDKNLMIYRRSLSSLYI